MKKFISALTSVALAATALGSTFAMNATAAVSSSIIDIRSGSSNTVSVASSEVAAGKVTVPVAVYLPQCSGINTMGCKFAINGDKTLGQAPATSEYLFGNYGIEMVANAECNADAPGYPNPAVFGEDDGDVSWETCGFQGKYYNLSYQNQTEVQANKNCFALGDGKSTTWDKTADWAYDYPIFLFDLVLPKGLADGEYVLDIYKPSYVNVNSIGSDELVYGHTTISGVDGAVDYTTVPLTIKVGDGKTPDTTTKAPDTTT